ncbi:MAG: hypothetical protein M1274_06225 [Actinobacteria bacterium]|nr:hypothetical protein [Actinomycetota bacterium]
MRSRRHFICSNSRAAILGGFGLALAALAALGLIALFYAGPASAHPGNTCDPEPGHGGPGCHVEVTTTTGVTIPSTTDTTSPAETTSTADTASATGVNGSSVSAGGRVPLGGSSLASNPSAPRTFVDKNNCLSCHGDSSLADLMTVQRPDGSSVSLYVDGNEFSNSVHRFNDCTTCHTDKPHDVETPLTKLSLAEKCGSCHQHEYDQYIKSVHGAPQANGNSDPATCVDCHSSTSNPHNIVRVLDPSASTYPKNIAQTCAKCHNDQKLMDKYGIVEKVYDSYMNSFHGKSISLSGKNPALQQLNTATCVNCHGSHNIALVSDPNSPVAGMDNLAKTCEQCHPGAGVEFAKGFLGHKEADPAHIPQVFWGEKFFFVFTRVVLAGGVALVAGPFARKGVDRIKRRRKPPKKEEE